MLLPQSILMLGIVALFGLVLGSFATAIAHRSANGTSWVSLGKGRRSACPQCQNEIQNRDLIPVVSWLLLKGKCRACAAPIPPTYPLIELAVAALCVLYAALHGVEPYMLSLPVFFVIPFLVALAFIDLRLKILPNQLVMIVGVLGILRALAIGYVGGEFGHAFLIYIGGAILYGAVSWILSMFMRKLLGRDALGFGDVKFFVVAGLWLGLINLANFMILGGVLGVVLGIYWITVRKEPAFPFGPALIAALYILLLV